MLEVVGLTKDYKTQRAVEDLSFNVGAGEIVGLLGPNGAGKTTAIRCCAGILMPSYGSVTIGGYDIVREPRLAKAELSFVPEVPNLYELLTVREHLYFIAAAFDRVDIYHSQGDDLLRRFSLLEKADQLVATLSKGMRQKLSVACALVHEAKVFLMDEPIIGIDPAGVAEFKRLLVELRESGAAILVSTHLLDIAERLCDRVVILSQGKKLAEGSLGDLRLLRNSDASLEELFLEFVSGAPPRALSESVSREEGQE